MSQNVAHKSAPSSSEMRSLSWSIKVAMILRQPGRMSGRISKNPGSLKVSNTTFFHNFRVCVIRDTLLRISSAWRSLVDSVLSDSQRLAG